MKKNSIYLRESPIFFSKTLTNLKNYDLIYIDGSHHGEQVFRDAKNCLIV